MLRRAVGGLAVLVALATSGCQVVLSTGIEANRDGSGLIRAAIGLDDEGLRELGDPVAELRLDDLREAGWQVLAPAKEADGLTWVRMVKPFSSPDEAGRVAAELSGPDGPFRQFRLERRRTLVRTTTSFTGVVDLSQGLNGLSDAALQEALGDASLGLDVEGLRERDVRVRVEARLPGEEPVVWEPAMGETLQLSASSEALHVRLLAGAGAALVFAAAALVLVSWRGRRS